MLKIIPVSVFKSFTDFPTDARFNMKFLPAFILQTFFITTLNLI